MEFYKEYTDEELTTACVQLNADVQNNEQWRSEVHGYTYVENYACILVRWVGLSETKFKESEE